MVLCILDALFVLVNFDIWLVNVFFLLLNTQSLSNKDLVLVELVVIIFLLFSFLYLFILIELVSSLIQLCYWVHICIKQEIDNLLVR